MPSFPSARTLVAQRPWLRLTLRKHRVHRRDIEDLVAECLLGAWRSIQKGRFSVSPTADPAVALRQWLLGIAWRLASHERARAHHRREVLAPDPSRLVAGYDASMGIALDPEGRLDARDALRALRRLRTEDRMFLLAAADASPGEIAASLGMSRTTVVTRIAAARKAFAAALEARPGDRRRRRR